MVSLDHLKELLPLLKSHGVVFFKEGPLEIGFPAQTKEQESPKIEEVQAQADMRADDLFNHDAVLHWSGSGDIDPMPLTGEETLAAP